MHDVLHLLLWSLNPGSVCIRSFPNVTGYCPVCPEGHLMGTTHPRALVLNNIFLNIKHHSQSLIEHTFRSFISLYTIFWRLSKKNVLIMPISKAKQRGEAVASPMSYFRRHIIMCSIIIVQYFLHIKNMCIILRLSWAKYQKEFRYE
jgi:hypothetical protein